MLTNGRKNRFWRKKNTQLLCTGGRQCCAFRASPWTERAEKMWLMHSPAVLLGYKQRGNLKTRNGLELEKDIVNGRLLQTVLAIWHWSGEEIDTMKEIHKPISLCSTNVAAVAKSTTQQWSSREPVSPPSPQILLERLSSHWECKAKSQVKQSTNKEPIISSYVRSLWGKNMHSE